MKFIRKDCYMNKKNKHFNASVSATYKKEKVAVAKFKKTLLDNNIEIPDGIGFYDTYQKEERDALYEEFKNENRYENDYNCHNTYFKFFISGFELISDIKEHDVSRLMVLATYLSHDNYLVSDDSGLNLKRSDLFDILKLPESTFKRTFKELKNHGYLIENEDGYRISTDVVHYGKSSLRPLKENERYTKMYKLAIRAAYNSLKPNQHKILGYMFKMIPYASADYWVLCHNPLEMNQDKIIPISLDELCDIVGYSKQNKRRLRSEINKIVFTYRGKNQRFMMSTITADDDEIFTINPNVVYGGNPSKKDSKVSDYFVTLEKWSENRKAKKRNMEV